MTEPIPVQELRQSNRFKIEPPMTGSFGSVGITIYDIGPSGIQIEHALPVRLGTNARLAFALPRSTQMLAFQGRVVWSKLSDKHDGRGKLLYRSGIQLSADAGETERVLSELVANYVARPDSDSLERKRQILEEKARIRAKTPVIKMIHKGPAIPPDQMLLIQQARERLLSHPDEAAKWYNRAKFSMPEGTGAITHREDVLAVWEFLERTVDLEVVRQVFDEKKGLT